MRLLNSPRPYPSICTRVTTIERHNELTRYPISVNYMKRTWNNFIFHLSDDIIDREVNTACASEYISQDTYRRYFSFRTAVVEKAGFLQLFVGHVHDFRDNYTNLETVIYFETIAPNEKSSTAY